MLISEKQRGVLFVLVGPGGAGKNALMKKLLADTHNLHKLVTATTRPPRSNETEGYDHYFVPLETFRQYIAAGRLLEHQEVTANKFYGIIKEKVDTALIEGHDLIADIEVYGAKILRTTYPADVVLVFVTVPGDTLETKLATLRERMMSGERREPDAVIEERLERARNLEFPFEPCCDYVIINADAKLDGAVAEMHTIIAAERKKRRSA